MAGVIGVLALTMRHAEHALPLNALRRLMDRIDEQ